MIQRKDIEIMAPVGSYESLNAAINAGADSVYFGVEQLNMRAASSVNFTLDDLAEIVRIAHAAGVKTYLTVNIVIYDDEMEVMRRIIDRAKAEGIDAIIATDLAAILYAREVGIEVHISTQSNISNITAVKFFAQWADVVVLARELSLEQIAAISKQIEEQKICGPAGELVKIEMFAHGAMCMSMSGKCYLSEHESHHSANRGACRQICRRKYTITDKDSGEQLDIDEAAFDSPKRTREIAQARQIAMYLGRNHTKTSLAAIGAQIGGKDHATVLHACNTVTDLIETDRNFKQYVTDIEKLLKVEQ